MKKIVLSAFCLGLMLAGCTQPGAQPTPATNQNNQNQNTNQGQPVTNGEEAEIVIQNFAFNPSVLTIAKGTTVIWTNQDSDPHVITSNTFNSGNLNRGDSFEFKFDTEGSFDYFCGIHPEMTGKIIVN